MDLKDRNGQILSLANVKQDEFLNKLYGTRRGRFLLKVLIRPFVSKIGGFALNRRISCLAIDSFIKNNNIDMSQYENRKFRSYNDFFVRKLRDGARVVDDTPEHLISPCDSKLTVYEINEDSVYSVKGAEYTLESLFRDKKLSEEYSGGYLLLFRLAVDDYHRYCYIDSGTVGDTHRISGVFHTVNPIAMDYYPIYKENTREYTILESDNFDKVLVMEVGALMVGKIINYDTGGSVVRGQEKGRFEFGGSTIIMCMKKDVVSIDADIIQNSKQGIETAVKYGSKIGEKK